MNNIIKITLFTIFVLFAIGLGIFGLSQLKVDEFRKAAVIFLVDSSASNQKDLASQKMIIRQLCLI